MNKKELVSIVSKVTHISRQEVELILTSTLETIMLAVSKKESVKLIGFGCFSSKERSLLEGIQSNLHSHKTYNNGVRFSPGKFFRQSISKNI
nr:DNA binding histon like protein [Cryptomonas sp. NIES-345]BDA98437.1 DNA binding histon like protein [Cryptomonas sp. NIES-1327]